MKIAFHGAAKTVTGSKHLMTLDNGKKILLDCGMYQGMGKETPELNRDFGFDPASVDYMILSHAHIDHSGLIPLLVKNGFSGKIFCTPATKDLASIMLEDSAGIQENDVKYENKRRALEGKPYLEPLYTTLDAFNAIEQFVAVDYDKWTEIEAGVSFCYTDVGHIIGSAAVHVRFPIDGKQNQLTFSGDVGRYRDIILRSPATFSQADYIIIESTYGNSLHQDFVDSTDLLLDWITKTCIKNKGKLIIPAFSVGRTQEILYALNQLEEEGRLPAIEYFVDSPLSSRATEIIKSYPQYFNARVQKLMATDKEPFSFRGLKFTKSVDESKMLNYYKNPCVIISASGMADAGRIKHHISNNIENSRNAILMSGYCEPRSLGGRLKLHPEEVSIFGQVHQVNAAIGEIRSMSAHGDYEDLVQFLSCQDPKHVKKLFLVHGEVDVMEDFRTILMKKGFTDVVIPERHYEIGLK